MYFEQGKNRSVFALLLLCFSLLECMFFLYASSGMYSPIYPAVKDVLCVSIIACLCYFLDFNRKMNPLFLCLGTIALSLFSCLCSTYFNVGAEEGFYSLADPAFWGQFIIVFFVYAVAVLGTGFLQIKLSAQKAVRFFAPFVILIANLFWGRPISSSILLFLFQIGLSFYCDRLNGGIYQSSWTSRILLVLLFLISTVLLFVYRGGLILTHEACSFPIIFLVLVGIILFNMKKLFGIYAVEYLCAHLCFSYLISCLEHAIDVSFLFALIPFGILFIISSFIHMQSDHTLKEVAK